MRNVTEMVGITSLMVSHRKHYSVTTVTRATLTKLTNPITGE